MDTEQIKKAFFNVIIIGFIAYLFYTAIYFNINYSYMIENNACLACSFNTSTISDFKFVNRAFEKCMNETLNNGVK